MNVSGYFQLCEPGQSVNGMKLDRVFQLVNFMYIKSGCNEVLV